MITVQLTRDKLLAAVAQGLLSPETADKAWALVRYRERKVDVLRRVAAGEIQPQRAVWRLARLKKKYCMA